MFCLIAISSNPPPGADKDELLDDDDVHFLTSSRPAASALLAAVYAELLEFVGRTSGRLQLPWGHIKKGAARGRFDERFLSVHSSAAPVISDFDMTLTRFAYNGKRCPTCHSEYINH
ncbi:Cytosolic 5'-nucleotidase 3A [Anabarilius grahami]|uniref:Cytosolic 5'-nucleotidase 3A n=1 Tax=Anabarilius grahami TaxID=495550 RepID=A0A3N0YGF3_ANAGA|nr:Cytosolic 5'-nucleotidase 3A [Anabarilius grahami]